MKILLLSQPESPLKNILDADGHAVFTFSCPIDTDFIKSHQIDFIVSYGYRHIIKPSVIEYMQDRIVNLHISYLPWNRGADPNLWSFLEDTPRGVSIHLVDAGIDTGDIIEQKIVNFGMEHQTLVTTYRKLQEEIICLFKRCWPSIAKGRFETHKQPTGGSFHKSSDKEIFMHLLINGWETPVRLIRGKALIKVNQRDSVEESSL